MPTKEEWYDQAIELQQKGDVDQAIAELEKLIEQHRDYALAHAALSVFYGRLEQHEKAIEHGRKVCDLEPNDPFSFVALSMICQKAGEIPQAEQALMQAREAQMSALHDDDS